MPFSLESLAAVLDDGETEATAPGDLAAPVGAPARKPHKPSLLHTLPVEILVEVAHCIRERHDLAAFIRTNRSIYRATNDVLYSKTIKAIPSGLLHWAAQRGGVMTARLALEAGADPDETWLSMQELHKTGHDSVPPFGFLPDFVSHAGSEKKRYRFFLNLPDPTGKQPARSSLNDLARSTGQYYWTPLHVAVYFGRSEMVQLLLDHGAALELRAWGLCPCDSKSFTRLGYAGARSIECTPLHVAICRGHMEIARTLLARGASAATAFDSTMHYRVSLTALHQAAHGGQLALVNFILDGDYQHDVDAKDFFDQTPLHYAVARKYWAVVQRLLEKGADINAFMSGSSSSYLRVTALHLAIDSVDYMSAFKLVDLGADLRLQVATRIGHGRFTPLMLMVRGPPLRSTQADIAEKLIKAIIEHGGKLEDQLEDTSWTPLEEAAHRHNTVAMRALLAAGAQIRDSLYLVCDHEVGDWYSGNDAIGLLVEHDADVNKIFPTPTGPRTALYRLCVGRNATSDIDINREHFSSVLDRYDMASKLVAAGAVPNPAGFPKGRWSKPLLRCFRRSEYDIIRLLVSQGVAISTQDLDAMFESACNRRALDGIDYLTELSSVAGHEGYVPGPGQECLRKALADGALDLVEAIHDFGIVPTETVCGLTPLHQACRHPWLFYQYARKLIEEGADPNARTSANETPLMFALEWKVCWEGMPLEPPKSLGGRKSYVAELILGEGGRWIWPADGSVLGPESSIPALCPIETAVRQAIPINKVSYDGFEALEALLAKFPLEFPAYPSQYLERFYRECEVRDRPEYLYHGTRLFISACVAPKQPGSDGPTATLLHLLRTMANWDIATRRWKDIVILALAALQEDGARWDVAVGDERPADFVHIRGQSDELDALAAFLRGILSLKKGAGGEILAVFKKPANLKGWDTKGDALLQRLLGNSELWGKPGTLYKPRPQSAQASTLQEEKDTRPAARGE